MRMGLYRKIHPPRGQASHRSTFGALPAGQVKHSKSSVSVEKAMISETALQVAGRTGKAA